MFAKHLPYRVRFAHHHIGWWCMVLTLLTFFLIAYTSRNDHVLHLHRMYKGHPLEICSHRGNNDEFPSLPLVARYTALCTSHRRICCADYDIFLAADDVVMIGHPTPILQKLNVTKGGRRLFQLTSRELMEIDPRMLYLAPLHLLVAEVHRLQTLKLLPIMDPSDYTTATARTSLQHMSKLLITMELKQELIPLSLLLDERQRKRSVLAEENAAWTTSDTHTIAGEKYAYYPSLRSFTDILDSVTNRNRIFGLLLNIPQLNAEGGFSESKDLHNLVAAQRSVESIFTADQRRELNFVTPLRDTYLSHVLNHSGKREGAEFCKLFCPPSVLHPWQWANAHMASIKLLHMCSKLLEEMPCSTLHASKWILRTWIVDTIEHVEQTRTTRLQQKYLQYSEFVVSNRPVELWDSLFK